MPLSRRDFCHLLGAGTAAPMILPRVQQGGLRRTADPLIRLDSNENPYGPSPTARAAMAAAFPECGRYPNSQPLVAAIARENGVAEANVLLTVGATEGLGVCARSFTAPATRPPHHRRPNVCRHRDRHRGPWPPGHPGAAP